MDRGIDRQLLTPDSVVRIARAAEQAGFGSIALTEHPAPSAKWLAAGGHESFDPLSALAFVAGVTERIRLLTYLLVLPYRNPLLAAKQAATVDVLSGGRLTLGVGTGYLRSEFVALGADFAERNELFDEAIEVMTGAWRTPAFHYKGRHFTALAQTQRPKPVQRPHPPLWVGGNGHRSRQRVARLGQGWTPLLKDAVQARTTRTAALSSPASLAGAVAELRELTEAAGRLADGIDVQADWGVLNEVTAGYSRIVDAVGQLAEAGATWVVFQPPGNVVEQTIDAVLEYGDSVIRSCRSPASVANSDVPSAPRVMGVAAWSQRDRRL
jgi:probable F420-dependent oxidoreductase